MNLEKRIEFSLAYTADDACGKAPECHAKKTDRGRDHFTDERRRIEISEANRRHLVNTRQVHVNALSKCLP